MSALCERRFIPPAGYWIVWPVLGLFIITADYALWRSQEARRASEQADPFSEANLERWTASCLERKARGRSCHVTFSFRYSEAPGDEQVAIVGVADLFTTITAPMQRGGMVSWRVDGLPFVETRSFEGDGAVLPHARSAKLLSELLKGKQLTVRFNEPQKGRRIERSIALDAFPKAYAAYRQLQASKPPQPRKLFQQVRTRCPGAGVAGAENPYGTW
jgi:hypothetical protein